MMLRYEAFAKHAPYMEKLSIDQNRVVLKDNKRNRIAEVMLKEGELQCLLDEKSDCAHVGFVYSLPELYNMKVVNTTVTIPAFLSMRSKPVSMNMFAVCLFITISPSFGFIAKSISSAVNCSNKRSNPNLPKVYILAEDSNALNSG